MPFKLKDGGEEGQTGYGGAVTQGSPSRLQSFILNVSKYIKYYHILYLIIFIIILLNILII